MTTKDEALRIALEALEEHDGNYAQSNASVARVNAAITAVKQAITPETGNSVSPLASAITSGNGQAQEPVEQVDLYGTKDGVLVHLGKAAMPPRMKARELAREQFGHFEDDDGSDADSCFYALERLIEYMYAQGFKIAHPAPKQAEPAWQPIETAPKDGTPFLGLRGNKIANCYRVQRDDCEMWSFGGSSGAVEIAPHTKPTHWMPLPTPPGTK